MIDYLQQGGWMMYAIAGTALLVYALLAERLLYYYWIRDHPQDTWRQVKHGERLAIIRALIVSLPLLGLLGTVGGMMATFSSLHVHGAGGAGGVVGAGISQALLTTQYALALAAPALLLERWMHSTLAGVERHDRLHELQGESHA